MNKLLFIFRATFVVRRGIIKTNGSRFESLGSFIRPNLNLLELYPNSFGAQQISLYSSTKKSKGKNEKLGQKEDQEEDDEQDDDDDEEDEKLDSKVLKSVDTSGFKPGFKILIKTVPSLRLDTVLSAGLTTSRNKIDDQFYSGRIRVNGEKAVKKSAAIKEGDRIDLIAESAEKNSAGLKPLKRVYLERVLDKTKKDRPRVVLVVWKSGLYEDEAYKF